MRSHQFLIACLLLLPIDCLAEDASLATVKEPAVEQIKPQTREECRSAIHSHKPSSDDVAADCLEAGIFDACDDAASTSSAGPCFAAHTKVAERRIAKAENTLVQTPRDPSEGLKINTALASFHLQWEKRINEYCTERNHVWNKLDEVYGIRSKYPDGIDTGQKFEDCLIVQKEELARELESFITELNKTKDYLQQIRIRGSLLQFLDGKSPLYTRQVGQ